MILWLEKGYINKALYVNNIEKDLNNKGTDNGDSEIDWDKLSYLIFFIAIGIIMIILIFICIFQCSKKHEDEENNEASIKEETNAFDKWTKATISERDEIDRVTLSTE